MAAKIRQNDEVIVLAGKDKGKRGKVTQVLPNGKVIVEGVNIVKKHQRPTNELPQGGIIEKGSSYPRIKRSSFGQKWCSWFVLVTNL